MKTRIAIQSALTLLLIGPWAGSLPAAGVGATYVKTLGQTNVKGAPFKTAGYRLTPDAEGNVYLAGIVNFPWSVVTKLAPDGRVIWETPCGGYNQIATTSDGNYLYAVTSTLLKRFTLAAGKEDADWGREWRPEPGKPAPVTRGTRGFVEPRSLLISGPYLYVVDHGGDELRRLDKTTGEDRPFKSRLMVVEPMDLARARNGNLLLLTSESVFEIDADGKPIKAPLIDGLPGAVAIDVDPSTGRIYLAVGGNTRELVNQIVEYAPDGKPTGTKIGRGGGFSGAWSADSFTFGTGGGDIALDPTGGIWVGDSGWRMDRLPLLIHLDKQYKPDRTIRGVDGRGLVVDADLNVYVGDTLKISWDNQLVWTSGLVNFGDQKQFPTTLTTWWFTPASVDAKTLVVFNPPASQVQALAADSGALVGGPYPTGPVGGVCGSGQEVFYLNDGLIKRASVAGLNKPEVFFTPPAGVKISGESLAVSADRERLYFCSEGKPVGYRKDGTKLWEGTSLHTPMALLKDVLFVRAPSGSGVAALDAKTGQSLGVFGDKEVDGRPAISARSLAAGSKDGKNYVFILGDFQIQVFEVNLE